MLNFLQINPFTKRELKNTTKVVLPGRVARNNFTS
jgi:hypothetical protein